LTLTSGDGDFCSTIGGTAELPPDDDGADVTAGFSPGAAVVAEGALGAFSASGGTAFPIPAGNGSFDSVVTISPGSVKYFAAVA
jgi:hypothetical protein